jgi:hypothetical protein
MKDEEISRLRVAFTAPSPSAWSPGTCLEPDRIWEAVRGKLPPEEIREIVDHVAVCASCAEDWRIAVAFEKESRSRSQEREAVVRPFPVRRLQPWIAAAAAALVLSVGGIYYQQTQKPVAPPEYRGEESKIESRTAATLSRQSCVLRWTPVQGAESYDLLVTTDDLLSTIADAKGLTRPEYLIPPADLTGLPPASQLYWRVTATFPDGGHQQSPTFTSPPI